MTHPRPQQIPTFAKRCLVHPRRMDCSDSVWVFNGARSTFPSGVFSTREAAERWIAKHSLSGTLTHYPIDVGMYAYAIAKSFFSPKKPDHATAGFIGKFSGGGINHFHYEDGRPGSTG